MEIKKLKYGNNVEFYPEVAADAVRNDAGVGMVQETWEFTLEDGTILNKNVYTIPPNFFYVENAFNGENTLSLFSKNMQPEPVRPSVIKYSYDKINWLDFSTNDQLIMKKKGDKIYFKDLTNHNFGIQCSQIFNVGGELRGLDNFEEGGDYSQLFTNTKVVDASNLLIYNCATKGCESMFEGCTSLISTPKFMGGTLHMSCFRKMFSGCTALTKAQDLPYEIVAPRGYDRMFEGCTALETAPKILATTMRHDACNYMFFGCTSLTNVSDLNAMTLEDSCYADMFRECTSLVKAPALPATTLASRCYRGMFLKTALKESPILPASTLVGECYTNMFTGCTKLNKVTAFFTTDITTPTNQYTHEWLYNTSKTGTFIKHYYATWENHTASGDNNWGVKYMNPVTGEIFDKPQILTTPLECLGEPQIIFKGTNNSFKLVSGHDNADATISYLDGDVLTTKSLNARQGNNPYFSDSITVNNGTMTIKSITCEEDSDIVFNSDGEINIIGDFDKATLSTNYLQFPPSESLTMVKISEGTNHVSFAANYHTHEGYYPNIKEVAINVRNIPTELPPEVSSFILGELIPMNVTHLPNVTLLNKDLEKVIDLHSLPQEELNKINYFV